MNPTVWHNRMIDLWLSYSTLVHYNFRDYINNCQIPLLLHYYAHIQVISQPPFAPVAALSQIITSESTQAHYGDEALEAPGLARLISVMSTDGGQVAVQSAYILLFHTHD
jgi:hypothetical protein